MPEAPRVSPQYVWDKTHSGADTLLVCAYDDPAKCAKVKLQGAIDMRQLEARLASVPKDREIVFYCA